MLNIKEIRKKKKLTQDELVSLTGIKKRTYVDYENGKADIPLSKLQIIAKTLNVSVSNLIGDVKNQEQPGNIINNNNGVPLIPVEAMAGWGQGDVAVMDYETETYKIPEFDKLKVDFMIKVKGSSMYPKYNSGDTVACRKIALGSFFQWNKVYVLDTSQGAMVKRIKKSIQEDHVLCVSDNKSYDPFDLPIEELYSIALVVGVIRLE